MKAKNVVMMLMAALLCFGTAAYGESEAKEGDGFIGIRMDTRPLPELLAKHLGLDEDQGIRIQNVGEDTPADKAGLERDDIIIAFEGKKVTDNEQFAEAVQKADAGADVSLEIIHLGQRKAVKLKLGPFTEDFKAKYPPEPELVESWQPGRMFRLQPDLEDWIQIGPDGARGGGGFGIGGWGGGGVFPINPMNPDLDKTFKERYTYHFSTDGEDYSVTIEGSPNDDDASIVVRIGGEEHTTTVGKIDKLPEKYRQAAEQAMKNARRTAKTRQRGGTVTKPPLPKVPDVQVWKDFQKKGDLPHQVPSPELGPGQDMLDRIEKQMRELQKRIEQLEKELGKKPGGSTDKTDKKEPQRKQPVEPKVNEAERI